MGLDRRFYCDFQQGLLSDWIFKTEHKTIVQEICVEKDQELIIGIFSNEQAQFSEYFIDDVLYKYSWSRSETAYILPLEEYENYPMMAFKHKLAKGKHLLRIEAYLNKNTSSGISPNIKIYQLEIKPNLTLKEESTDIIQTYPCPVKYSKSASDIDIADYKEGVGAENISIGRFGFTKGDGLLDCAMSTLGSVNRMHLFGHPDYQKINRWQYSFLPADIDPEKRHHGSFFPAQTGFEDDDISCNYLSVNWKTTFEKQNKRKVNFACTYSIASAGIMIETDDNMLSLSEFEFAGNYTRVMLPLEQGLIIRDISNSSYIYNREQDGEFKANWFLVFGATVFPDIPIQVVMQKKAQEINLERFNNCLSRIEVKTSKAFGLGFVVSPFGIEALKPEDSSKTGFIEDAYTRCDFWSQAVLAYPVDAEEFYKLDEDNEKIDIIQRFNYRIIEDEWGTIALQTAPLPPPLSIIENENIIQYDAETIDFKFPTKYGFLKGVAGKNYSCYSVPFMPVERPFPLKRSDNNEISELLAEDIDDYFKYHENFNDNRQATPFSGACTEPYAWTSSMGNYMDECNRIKIGEKAKERLIQACDPNHEYIYPIVNHSSFMAENPGTERVIEIYNDPELPTIKLHNWYWRKEPLSGRQYRLAYINVSYFSQGLIKEGSREEILNYPNSFIENDWGAGMGLYGIYLSALASGDFSPIKENWQLISEVFKYFETFHDWATMGSAFCENGETRVEGCGYGAFTSFVNMATAIGKGESYARGRYISSKYTVLRLAIFKSSKTYFNRFFNHPPWYITKFFHDEANPAQGFQNVPELWNNKYRSQGVFNLTTEGLFIETFLMLHKFMPKELHYLRDLCLSTYKTGKYEAEMPWIAQQEQCSCLLAAIADDNFDKEQLLEEIEELDSRGTLIRQWRAMHSFSRLLPTNYFKCLLLALLENREHPVWVELWNNMQIITAEYDQHLKQAIINFKRYHDEKMFIQFGIRETPSQILLNDTEITATSYKHSKLILNPTEPGVLRLLF